MEIVASKALSLYKEYPSEWNSFRAAKYRCTNPNATDYAYYGGRGIDFNFDSFAEFLLELGRKPSPDYTVERLNVNGHYEPQNVRWATRREQANNTRANRFITAFGETLTLMEWSRKTNIKRRNLQFRINAGWCLNCVFSSDIETCTHGYDRKKNLKKSARKRKNNHLITANGKTLTQVEWSEVSGLKQTCISMRLYKYGWCPNCAVTLPKKDKCLHISKNNSFLT